jgi:hypothetical protein
LNGPSADTYPSFGAYQRSLTLKCDEGEPGIITWTPDRNTPDTVYYQCFSHRYLGWKINVLDHCESAQGSEIDEVFVDPEDAVVAEPSINHESKILPSENFLQKHEKDLIKHHNMNATPPKISVDFQKNSEIQKLIADGIKTAEALEESILNSTRYTTPSSNTESYSYKHREGLDDKDNDDEDLIEAIARLPQHNVKPIGRPLIPPGLPAYLRPPQNPNLYPYRPASLPVRRPISIERRPVSRPQRPFLLPQSTMIINHFKNPSANFAVRNFMKPKLHKPHASVLMLGEPTEIKPFKKLVENPHTKPFVVETAPMMKFKKSGEPVPMPPRPSKYAAKKDKYIPRNSFKDPFEIRNESAQIQVVKNTGFKPDSVVIESGFKPIQRRDEDPQSAGSVEEVKISQRRRDDFISDIDEAIESDALLINNDEPQKFFEPMFIPSPLDSVALAQVNATSSMVFEDGEDKFAEANERQDYFYLPPESKKLIAFDGALLNSDPTKFNRNDYVGLSSKTQQFIKETPQFGVFRGEIPKDLILQISANRAEDPISEYTDPTLLKDKSPISTKLSVVKSDDPKKTR